MMLWIHIMSIIRLRMADAPKGHLTRWHQRVLIMESEESNSSLVLLWALPLYVLSF